MTKKNEALGTSAIGVRYVPTKQLHANPHNPRMLFDKLPLNVLRESIGRVGILVPLTVYLESARNRYVILDGQRRWICAQEVGLDKVPVNQVAEPSLVQNIVTMFQIHMSRGFRDVGLLTCALSQRFHVFSHPLYNPREPEFTPLHRSVDKLKSLLACDINIETIAAQENVGSSKSNALVTVEKAVVVAKRFHQRRCFLFDGIVITDLRTKDRGLYSTLVTHAMETAEHLNEPVLHRVRFSHRKVVRHLLCKTL